MRVVVSVPLSGSHAFALINATRVPAFFRASKPSSSLLSLKRVDESGAELVVRGRKKRREAGDLLDEAPRCGLSTVARLQRLAGRRPVLGGACPSGGAIITLPGRIGRKPIVVTRCGRVAEGRDAWDLVAIRREPHARRCHRHTVRRHNDVARQLDGRAAIKQLEIELEALGGGGGVAGRRVGSGGRGGDEVLDAALEV